MIGGAILLGPSVKSLSTIFGKITGFLLIFSLASLTVAGFCSVSNCFLFAGRLCHLVQADFPTVWFPSLYFCAHTFLLFVLSIWKLPWILSYSVSALSLALACCIFGCILASCFLLSLVFDWFLNWVLSKWFNSGLKSGLSVWPLMQWMKCLKYTWAVFLNTCSIFFFIFMSVCWCIHLYLRFNFSFSSFHNCTFLWTIVRCSSYLLGLMQFQPDFGIYSHLIPF